MEEKEEKKPKWTPNFIFEDMTLTDISEYFKVSPPTLKKIMKSKGLIEPATYIKVLILKRDFHKKKMLEARKSLQEMKEMYGKDNMQQ